MAVLAYPSIPGEVADTVYLLLAAGVAVAVVAGVRLYQPSLRRPWYLIAAAFAALAVGDTIYTSVEQTFGTMAFPGPADVVYLAFYPLLFSGLAQFLRAGGARDRSAWVDTAMWTIGIAVLAWEPLIERYALDPNLELQARLVALAYPLLDLGLLVLVLRIAAGRGGSNRSYLLLAAAIGIQTLTDVVYAGQVLRGTSVDGGPLDLGWLLVYVLAGASALHPSMATLTDPCPGRVPNDLPSRRRLLSLVPTVLVPPALLGYLLVRDPVDLGGAEHRWDVAVVLVSSVAMLGLAMLRASGLLRLAHHRTRELRARQGELERSTAELQARVSQDPLTGLASRDRFVDALDAQLARGHLASVAFLDLDDFKSINDTLGHAAGDRLLCEVAGRLREAASPYLVARFGGDEFAVLVEDDDVAACADRLVAALQQRVVLHGNELSLQVSIGVTTARTPTTTSGELLREADIAMYTAKREGGGWTRYRGQMSTALVQRMELRANLVDGLRDGRVVPWFQPVVDLRSGALLGFEALARWYRDGEVAVPPDVWLPLAEETGLVVSVDRAVFRAAVTQLAAWRDRHGADDLTLSVNVSARTLQHRGIAEEMLGVLADLRVPAHRLVVEVTESVLIEDELVSARLQLLRGEGVRVALDDFGTGWSSLSYLRRFPVDMLKLDRSFTAELGLSAGGTAVPAAVLQLARALRFDVVAEGVETLEQRLALLDLGFRTAQGYLFGRAMTARWVEPLVATHAAALAAKLAAAGGTLSGTPALAVVPVETAAGTG